MTYPAPFDLTGKTVLVTGAGIADAHPAPVHEFSSADWHQVIDIDLHGVFYSAKHSLKMMVAQGSGKIVNIASMWGTTGPSSVFPIPAYSASKGAVVNLTRELGLESPPRASRSTPSAPAPPHSTRRWRLRRPRLRRRCHCIHSDGPGRRGIRDPRSGVVSCFLLPAAVRCQVRQDRAGERRLVPYR